MICPNCTHNTIPFRKVWLKGGFGTYQCPQCGMRSRVKKSAGLATTSCCLGGFAGGAAAALGACFHSWPVFYVSLFFTFAVALVIDAAMDFRFRRLERVDPQDQR